MLYLERRLPFTEIMIRSLLAIQNLLKVLLSYVNKQKKFSKLFVFRKKFCLFVEKSSLS